MTPSIRVVFLLELPRCHGFAYTLFLADGLRLAHQPTKAVKSLLCFCFSHFFSFVHDCSIKLWGYEFISNFVLDISEVVFGETSSLGELEVRNECLMVDQERCTMLSVLNVDKNVKFHSNLTQADQSIAENVMLNEDPREEIDIKLIS